MPRLRNPLRRCRRLPRPSALWRAQRRSASAADSGVAQGRMAAPGNDESRDSLEQLLLAGVGVVALTADRVEDLVDSLVKRGGVQRDEARAAVEHAVTRWRGDATRVTERAGAGMQGILRELGLVLRSEYEELELRLAQVEHRLRLLERDEDLTLPPAA